MSSGTHSASRAIPALPGAHRSFVVSGEAAIFQASACSRPPEPMRRIFIAPYCRKKCGIRSGFSPPRLEEPRVTALRVQVARRVFAMLTLTNLGGGYHDQIC